MKLDTSVSLMFDGDCETAFKFYERLFGAKITMLMPWGSSPLAAEAPEELGAKILHVSLPFNNITLMGGDARPGQYDPPQGFAIVLSLSDPAEAERLFDALAEKGRVRMPLQETFWAARYGSVVDRFRIPWEINCEKPS
jgi:PhnB protein